MLELHSRGALWRLSGEQRTGDLPRYERSRWHKHRACILLFSVEGVKLKEKVILSPLKHAWVDDVAHTEPKYKCANGTSGWFRRVFLRRLLEDERAK